jgi:putative membrane protein
MRKVPVFFIDGFLEAGKTTFIIDTLKSDIGENMMKTLLLVCEEGEVEYDPTFLATANTVMHVFESEEDFDYKVIEGLVKDERPDRIVIEMNGMWDLTRLQFPKNIEIVQIVEFIDASTFAQYYKNMSNKFTEIIKRAHLVCFTKCDNPEKQLEPFKSALKLVNGRCQYYIMDENMNASDAFKEPLPYDVNADVIKIAQEDYGTFYIDTFDNKDTYNHKVVEYDIMVIKSSKLPKNTFIAGRFIMNCCANDTQLYGFLVKDTLGKDLIDRQWIRIRARVEYEWSEEYNEEELVLYPMSIETIEGPKDSILNLTGN